MYRLCVLSLLTCALLAGCVPPPTGAETHGLLTGAWAGMTYEEALSRLGLPARCEEAGTMRVCVWVMGSGGQVAHRVGDFTFVDTLPDDKVELTFMDNHLARYRLQGRWR
jgi:hypothetical protein